MSTEPIEILSVNLSSEKGTLKRPAPLGIVRMDGLIDDAHAGAGPRQVSLLAWESVERFGREAGRRFAPGDFAENLTTRGLPGGSVALLDRLRIGAVELEVSQIGKSCHGGSCAIFREVGRCVMPHEGYFTRVIKGGVIRPGNTLVHIPKTLRFLIVTVSDRASRGEYADRSGPRLRDLIGEFMDGKRWRAEVESTLVPDDPESLGRVLDKAREDGVDVVLTTGGTGIGPRDITPDVVIPRCSKQIPGVMEHIRVTFGRQHPEALLSRGVAGVMGGSLVYTLPGSRKAVEEYMGEIAKTLEHQVLTLHDIDVHASGAQARRTPAGHAGMVSSGTVFQA